MKSNHTKGNWSKGKGGWCIVTDDKSEIDLKKRDTPDSVEYYGGALICESVKDKDINIISASPELLEALQESNKDLIILHGHIYSEIKKGNTQWEGVDEIIYSRIEKNKKVIKKALGNE